jgi:hypothetical protein
MATTTERKAVRVNRSPPRRVLASDRYRTTKTQADRDVWAACMEPIDRLRNEGWRVVAVAVDWGPALPMTARWREEAIRDLLGCYDGCEIRETVGDLTRGSTLVEMERYG